LLGQQGQGLGEQFVAEATATARGHGLGPEPPRLGHRPEPGSPPGNPRPHAPGTRDTDAHLAAARKPHPRPHQSALRMRDRRLPPRDPAGPGPWRPLHGRTRPGAAQLLGGGGGGGAGRGRMVLARLCSGQRRDAAVSMDMPARGLVAAREAIKDGCEAARSHRKAPGPARSGVSTAARALLTRSAGRRSVRSPRRTARLSSAWGRLAPAPRVRVKGCWIDGERG
jgi:hypothetical protein